MKKEFKILLSCFSYFTRIPTWKLTDISDVDMKQTSKYFPIIGWIIGGIAALTLYFLNYYLPLQIAILLSMATSLILTGAIHEDGFADVCDGFGGGYTKKRILEIMKDSSTGAFGAIGLIMILGFKFIALSNIPMNIIIPTIIIAHSISRCTSISFLYTHTYARNDDSSKSTVFVKRPPLKELLLILTLGIIPFFMLPTQMIIPSLVLIIPIFITKTLLGMYFKKKIGGYTGDCMGATQQVVENLFYIGILVITNHVI